MMKFLFADVILLIWCLLPQIESLQVTRNSLRRSGSFLNTKNHDNGDDSLKPKRICIIGGGWAGFSAADALSSCNNDQGPLQIEILDASPRGPGGLAGGWRTKKLNRPVEGGLHGFWREYTNTFAAIERIGLDLDDILTPYTPSVLVSQSGRVALAPVMGENDQSETNQKDFSLENIDWSKPSSVLSVVANLLPPPLDVALLSDFNKDSPLTVADRISALGLLGVWSDFEQEDPESWNRYDKISADTLFRSVAGVSPNLYRDLVSPLLHVLPMTPGYDCSAAAALSCFHVFALQAKGAFDVRWCRGTISEQIFNPWAEKLQSGGNVNIRGGARVTSIEEAEDEGSREFIVEINGEESMRFDAIVLAVGGTAMKKLLPCSSVLASLAHSENWKKFRGVTCVAVRLFFKPSLSSDGKLSGIPAMEKAMKDSPIFVCGPNIGGIPELTESGFCIYDLQRLHDEFSLEQQQRDGSVPCIAYEVDFFRANALASMEDDATVANVALKAMAAALDIPSLDTASLLDVSVVRAKDAVSHFCVDSASWSPPVKLGDNLYICGDWIDRTGHASWSTEKSVVTARQAAASLAKDLGLDCDAEIIPAAPDTPQLSVLRQIAKTIRRASPIDVLPSSPWILAKQLLGGRP
jgi:uncharacterized protein with NAD-binding domain and iron-sulfur cluster